MPATGLVAQLLLLDVLADTTGLGTAGWVAGAGSAVAIALALTWELAHRPGERLGPASWVTMARATLAVGVAALVAHSLAHDVPVGLLVTLAAVALALDLVDGWLARRTGTATDLGARFDGEVDAFLILALSVYVVASTLAVWVLAIGAARYLFAAGEWLLPWMRAPLPPRRWRKVVAAAQGVLLTVAAAGVVPRTAMQVLLAAALVLLAASMGECTWWLWRRRQPGPSRVAAAVTALALVVVWVALDTPDHPRLLSLGTFTHLPLELLIAVALAALLPARPRRALAVAAGLLLSALLLVKVLDIGFYTAFDRKFDPIYDWGYAGIGVETLRDAIGRTQGDIVIVVVLAVAIAVLVLPLLGLLRVTRVAADHRRHALGAAAVLGAVWVVLRLVGAPAAATTETALAVREVHTVQRSLQDHSILARAIAHDRFRATPGDRLLTALRGKDVLLLFVESYGRVAVQGSPFSGADDAVLARGTAQLRAAGFGARSAFLTSPTFGGISWLAHITMQSGIWANSRRRYDQLVNTRRFTLSQAFRRAGWRVVADLPQDKRPWRQGRTFYHYDRVYNRHDLGYRGPLFGLPSMPDQFALAGLQRLELGRRHRPPVFAEVDLVSSHTPWTRIPELIPWNRVGDGSIFRRLPVLQPRRTGSAATAYGVSIRYTMRTVVSFLRRYGTDRTVVIALGDHQPNTTVTGLAPSHDVPVSIIARDPRVLRRIAGWGWQDGLRPRPQAPVWPMSAFRDRFLSAFSTPRSAPTARSAAAPRRRAGAPRPASRAGRGSTGSARR